MSRRLLMSDAAEPLRVLVVDDERTARGALVRMLAEVPAVTVVAEADDVPTAIAAVRTHRPEAMLLDVQLPSGTGFDVLRATLPDAPATAMVTAHDRYALAAFELAALDYVLKPFTLDRLTTAIERLRHAVATRDDASPRVAAALAHVQEARPLERLYVRRGRQIVMVPVAEIVRIEADGMYTRVVTAQDVHVVLLPVHEMLERLPADRFLRVHRSHVVNLAMVTAFTALPSGRLRADLRTGESVPCSREYARQIRDQAW
jgi:two-component system LytT family response regulator